MASNSNADDDLAIWDGDDDTETLVDDEVEIFGELIFISEPVRWLLLGTGLSFLAVLYRLRGRWICA